MQSPYESTYTVLDSTPGHARYTKVLRPYITQLLSYDAARPMHANSYNRFNITRDPIVEDTLEYWIEDAEEDANDAADADDLELGEDDDSDDDAIGNQTEAEIAKSRRRKRRMRKNKAKQAITPHNQKWIHDTQVAILGSDPRYELNSNEVIHLKQQMYLSLKKRATSRRRGSSKRLALPTDAATKDLNRALIALSGKEPALNHPYFDALPSTPVNDAVMGKPSRLTFLRYLSHTLNTLFYTSLYKQDWSACYACFSTLVRTYSTDVLQIWPLGVHILTQLNTQQFKDSYHEEWKILYPHDRDPPFLSERTLEDLAFLQNPTLIPTILKDDNPRLLKALKGIFSKRRPMHDTILSFLRLLIRTSSNQQPLSGAFPEQDYVPGGLLQAHIGEFDEDGGDTQTEAETEAQTDTDYDTNAKAWSEREVSSNSSSSDENEDDADKVKIKLEQLTAATASSHGENGELIIHASEFNPGASSSSHRPYLHPYRVSLRHHTTPVHRHGSRVRTPTYTLSYLWILVRTGKISTLQRALEPMLLVVPSSTDARVALVDVFSRVLDLVGEVQEIIENKRGTGWDSVERVKVKLQEAIDSWDGWKVQFTSRKKKKRKGVRQFVGYEGVETSLQNLKRWVGIFVSTVQNGKKNKAGNGHDVRSSGNFNGGHSGRGFRQKRDSFTDDSSYMNAETDDGRGSDSENDRTVFNDRFDSLLDEDANSFVEADKEDYKESDDIEEVEVEIDEDEEEIRQEMDRLLGHTSLLDDEEKEGGNAEDEFEEQEEEEEEEEDDEEVQREMERLMGYSEVIDNEVDGENNVEEDDGFDNYVGEEEQFYNEYIGASNNDAKLGSDDSD